MVQPSTDRHWRAWLGAGLVFSAIGVAVIIATLIPEPPHGASWIIALTHLDWTLLWMGFIFALFGYSTISQARKSHRRERQRARAMAGDETAMGLARVKLHGVAPADVEREELALLWLPERVSWVVVGLLLFLALLVVAMMTAIVIALVESVTSEMPWGVIAGGAVVGVLVIALGVWLRARRLTKATGVVATRAGLRAMREGKERAFIPWSEARLLESWNATSTRNESGFALSSARALVEWRDYPAGRAPAAADGASSEAMYLRAQTLLATVIARTGLEPRACALVLPFEEQVEAPVVGWRSWLATLGGYAVLLGIVGALLLTAANALLTPLTRSLVLNLYVAATMGGLGLTLLAWLAWGLIRRVRGAPHAPTERPAIQLPAPPETGTAPLRMRVLTVWRDNAILIGILALVVVEFYAMVHIFTDSILTLDVAEPWWDPPMLSVITIGMTAILSAIFTLAILFSRTMRGAALAQGLELMRGARRIVIPWEMVAELVITVARDRSVMYKVVASDSLGTKIVWPDDVGLDGVTPAPGESPGAVFAAVVAQRAGVTPRVVYK